LKIPPEKYNGLTYRDKKKERASQEPFEGAIPSINVASGMSKVERIMEAIGLRLEHICDRKGRSSYRLIGEG
jgi:hypothetical protein